MLAPADAGSRHDGSFRMTRHVLLNNVEHASLCIRTARSAALGDAVMCTPTFHREFRNLQAHYPIVFRKDAGGRFQAVALLGFEEGENLFLGEHGWDAAYVPLTIERQPFLIGFDRRDEGGEPVRTPVVHVDLDSPRVSDSDGEPLFLEHGGSSDYLKRITSILKAIHEGFEADRAFIDALVELELIESFVLDVELAPRSQHRLVGFYTINEDRLDRLPGEALARLNARGWLKPVYMAVASLSNLRDLIERRRARERTRS
jgi:hypothetical protein